MSTGEEEYVPEVELRETLGLSRLELKTLRGEAPAGGVIQKSDGQGKKPKALHPWYWSRSAVEWLSSTKINLEPVEKKEVDAGARVKILTVSVSRCTFPNKRIFEAKIDGKYVLMVNCKDATKLRPKQTVKVKFSNGRAFLVSDKKGRAK